MTKEQINNNKFNNIRNLKIDLGIFKGGERITQRFNDKEGLKYVQRQGHDGLDLVPFVGGNNDIYSPIEGTVIFQGGDSNYPFASRKKFWGYGLFVIIYDSKNNLLWLFGHLSKINVKHNQRIKVGDLIGKMGRSGFGILNRYPLHLHLGRYEVDNNIKILNQENGFWGGTDPLILLDEKNNIENMKLNNIINALANSNIADKENIIHSLREHSNDDTYIVRALEALQNNYNSCINTYNNKQAEIEQLNEAYQVILNENRVLQAEKTNMIVRTDVPFEQEKSYKIKSVDSVNKLDNINFSNRLNEIKENNNIFSNLFSLFGKKEIKEKTDEIKEELKKGKKISWKRFTSLIITLIVLIVPHFLNIPEFENFSKILTEDNLQYVIMLLDSFYIFFQTKTDLKNDK